MDFANEIKPRIAFFPKIFVEDCGKTEFDRIVQNCAVEDIADLKPSNEPSDSIVGQTAEEYLDTNQRRYDEIPRYFVRDNWIQSTNLLCCYCHGSIPGIPFPIPLNRTKTLIPEHNMTEAFALIRSGKSSDDPLLISSKVMHEIRAYELHRVLCCDAVCAGNYIRRVDDHKIINKRETLQMITAIHTELHGTNCIDIPEKDLWIVMQQYSGPGGQSRAEYVGRNVGKATRYSDAISTL